MNIPQFMAVLEAVVRKNVDLARAGRPVKYYLVPMAWGDPGLGKTDVVEAVAEGLGGLGRDVFGGADDAGGYGIVPLDIPKAPAANAQPSSRPRGRRRGQLG